MDNSVERANILKGNGVHYGSDGEESKGPVLRRWSEHGQGLPLLPTPEAASFAGDRQKVHNVIRTGRQRKKSAARTKGGEFQARWRKRRVYTCTISDELDVEKLQEILPRKLTEFKYSMNLYTGTVLHIFVHGTDLNEEGIALSPTRNRKKVELIGGGALDQSNSEDSHSGSGVRIAAALNLEGAVLQQQSSMDSESSDVVDQQRASILWHTGSKELFVFDFGCVVFWGFEHDEERKLLEIICRLTLSNATPKLEEFEEGEDDMAFVVASPFTDASMADSISIANDVFTLPEDATAKQRLAVSFAIAQSSVLAIFEARIEKKVEAFKYIPETMAACGKVKLSPKKLGNMIGEVFVIRFVQLLYGVLLIYFRCYFLIDFFFKLWVGMM